MANLSVRISSPTAIWQKNAQAIVQERMQFVSQQTSVADLHRARTTSDRSQSRAIRGPHTFENYSVAAGRCPVVCTFLV